MSAVTKCDICGGIYNVADCKQDYGYFKLVDPKLRHSLINHNSYDCCPECAKKIAEFIDVLKTGENYCIYVNPYDDIPYELCGGIT